MTVTQRIRITVPMLWLGFVLSISFMEAWLKFQAEGVTQVIGLSIGRLVFGALNKVELSFFALLFVCSFKSHWFLKKKMLRNVLISLGGIVLLQTFHLLPILDQQAEMIINNRTPSVTYFHFYYVVFESLKVMLLFVFTQHALTKVNERTEI